MLKHQTRFQSAVDGSSMETATQSFPTPVFGSAAGNFSRSAATFRQTRPTSSSWMTKTTSCRDSSISTRTTRSIYSVGGASTTREHTRDIPCQRGDLDVPRRRGQSRQDAGATAAHRSRPPTGTAPYFGTARYDWDAEATPEDVRLEVDAWPPRAHMISRQRASLLTSSVL